MIDVKKDTPVLLFFVHLGSGLTALILAVLLGSAAAQSMDTKTYTETILHSFSGSPHDGAMPTAGIVLDAAGNIYGTTYYGGGSSNYGTVFKINTNSTETVLYRFIGHDTDGANPAAPLLLDSQGDLYGTTVGGGGAYRNFGTVFKLPAKGAEQVLYRFDGLAGGFSPFAGLLMDKFRNLYGTAQNGGNVVYSDGVVFKLDESGNETAFPIDDKGAFPLSGVLLDQEGNIYGTTSMGPIADASCNKGLGCGVVYELSVSGDFNILHTFPSFEKDGQYPFYGDLVRDAQGSLYGCTYRGGTHGYGTVFKLRQNGDETALYNFRGAKDGSFPLAGLVQDEKGNFYGTTYQGGAWGYGTVFMVTAIGRETVLYSFKGTEGDGAYPMGTLMLDANGNLYGTTQSGGAYGLGTVFKLAP